MSATDEGTSAMPKASLLLVTVGNVASAAAQWYLVWLFARQDGAVAVGQYSTLIAALTPVFILSQLGLRNLFLTLRRHVRWRTYLGVRMCTAFIATIVGVIVLLVLGVGGGWAMAAAVLAIKVCDTVADLFFARLQRAERLVTFGLLLIGGALASAAVVTVVMSTSGSVVASLWGVAATAAVVTAATVRLGLSSPAPRSTAAHEHADPADPGQTAGTRLLADTRALLYAGLPLSLMQGIYALTSYTPLAVVALFGTAADVGRYASAAYLVVFANLVGASLETVMLPAYRRHVDECRTPSLLRTALIRGLTIMAVLSPLIVLALFVGNPLLTFVYGEDFALSVPAVGMLSLAAVITVPTYLLSATLLVLNRYWATTAVGAASVAVALGSGWAAGALGAAAVDAGCFALLCGTLSRYAGELILAALPAGSAKTVSVEVRRSSVADSH